MLRSLTAELLKWDHTFIKLLIFSHYDLLIVTFTNHYTSVTPTKVVHTPEGINW